MPIPPGRLDANGKLIPFTPEDIVAMNIRTRGVRDGSHPTNTRSMNSATTLLKYFVAPSQYDSALVFLLGASVAYTSPIDGKLILSRLMPHTLPNEPQIGCTKLERATGFRFERDVIGDDLVPMPTYTNAELEIVAEILPFALAPDAPDEPVPNDEELRYVEILPSTAESQYISLNGSGGMFYRQGPADGKPVPFNYGVIRNTSIIKRRWHRIPRVCWGKGSALYTRLFGDPDANLTGLIGTINSDSVLGYAPGQLLLMAPEEEWVFDPVSGDFAWNLTYVWKFDPRGHCHMPWYVFPNPVFWAFVSNDGAYHTYAALPGFDNVSLFNARPHGGANGVFDVG